MKGVDPVIAVVVLVAISIAMVGALYSWYSGAISIQEGTIENSANCVFTSIEVRSVVLSDGSGAAIVENTGSDPVEINTIILETQSSLESYFTNQTIEGRSISSLPFPYIGECSEFRSVIVYTNCAG